MRLDADGVAEVGAVFSAGGGGCFVSIVGVGVGIIDIIVWVFLRRVGEGAAAETELDEGLEGREAGAGDADGDVDGGPDEGAGVGPGDICLVDVEDGPDADDGGAADAVGEGEALLWGLDREDGGKKERGSETYKAPRRNMAVRVTFCRIVRLRLQTGAIGSIRITTSRRTFVTAVPRSEALLLIHLLCGYGRIHAALTGMHWNKLEKTMAMDQHITSARTT